ncbi:MAG: DUF2336 domain-containing protein [Xanthobacteraceae bacterium]
MSAENTLLAALDTVVQHGSPDRRAEMLQRITSLFIDGADRFSDEHVALFDDVIGRLIVEIESKARAELSVRLASIGNAPPEVVRALAQDEEISVAGPMLQRSPCLDESDLLDVARSKGQAHLLAIASRETIAERVTDVIVRRGDRDVVRSIAANPGARLSEAGYSALVKKAVTDGVLAETVFQREDLPPQLFHELVVCATEFVQKRLLATAKPEVQAEIQRVLAQVSTEVETETKPRDYSAAKQSVAELQRAGKLDEVALTAFAGQRRYEETVVSLSVLCKVSIEVLDRMMLSDRSDPLLILCKAAGFGWPTARAIIQARPGGKGLSEKSLETALRNFERLGPATAQRVVRFWQTRPGA